MKNSEMQACPAAVLFSLLIATATLLAISPALADTTKTDSILLIGSKNFPPFQFKELGKPKGLMIDLTKAVAEEAGLDIKVQLKDWNKAQELVLAGTGVGHSLMGQTPERHKHYDFAQSTVKIEFTLFARRQGITKITPDSLSGMKIAAVQKSMVYDLLAREYPNADLVPTQDTNEGIGLLLEGKISAVATGRLAGLYLLNKHAVDTVVPVSWSFATEPLGIAIRKGNAPLVDKLNLAINRLNESGQLDDIRQKWVSGYSQTDPIYSTARLILMGIGGLVFFGMVVIAVGRSRRSNPLS